MELVSERNGRVKVGLDSPCPCGSGKKYRKCHGRGERHLPKGNCGRFCNNETISESVIQSTAEVLIFVCPDSPESQDDCLFRNRDFSPMIFDAAWACFIASVPAERRRRVAILRVNLNPITYEVLHAEMLVGKGVWDTVADPEFLKSIQKDVMVYLSQEGIVKQVGLQSVCFPLAA